MTDEVLFARPHADAALAPPPLISIVADRRALDVAGVADGDRHVFFGDQVLDAEFTFIGKNLSSAWIAVFRLNLAQFIDDDLHHELVAAQDREQPLDQLQQFGELVQDLLAFETCQPLKLHVQNGLCLDL